MKGQWRRHRAMRRRAGRSTLRMLRRVAWADARRAWKVIAIFLIWYCLITTVVVVIQRTPFLKGLTLGVMLGLLGMFGALFLVATGVAQRQMGGAAEQWTADELAKLPRSRWQVIHDIAFESYNVDHVIVGPGRVYAVETKWTTWGDNPKFLDSAVGSAQRAARKVRSLLRSHGAGRDVVPLLVVWGPNSRHKPAAPQWVDGVGVLVGVHAENWLPLLDGSARAAECDQEVANALNTFIVGSGEGSWSAPRTAAVARA